MLLGGTGVAATVMTDVAVIGGSVGLGGVGVVDEEGVSVKVGIEVRGAVGVANGVTPGARVDVTVAVDEGVRLAEG